MSRSLCSQVTGQISVPDRAAARLREQAGTEEAGQHCSPGGSAVAGRSSKSSAHLRSRAAAHRLERTVRYGCGREHCSSWALAVHASAYRRQPQPWNVQEEHRGRRGLRRQRAGGSSCYVDVSPDQSRAARAHPFLGLESGI
ncbi:g382 [Coccomyxa elongata]